MKKAQILVCAFIASLFISQVKAQDTSKDAVINAYFGVKNALISANSTEASAKATVLLTAVASFPVAQLSADQKAAWTKYTDKLQFDARHIAESRDITHQREHFASLSENMFAVLKATKLNAAPVYRDYCPMKKSYWLSETAAIKNPYYGNQMLTCGEAKETLPAAK